MQLDLFASGETPKLIDEETFICRVCNEDLPISAYQVRSDRSGYRAKSCKKCSAKEATLVNQLKRTAPPKSDTCDCCGVRIEEGAAYFDHCHETKKFRGWLCNTCNSGIGILGDDIPSLKRALDYLQRHYDGQP